MLHGIEEYSADRLFYHLSSSHPTVSAGSLSNAALVGAKTVNGPALESDVTSSACFNAATSVV